MNKIEDTIFYIAGPVTGLPHGNRPMFEQAQYWLEEQGAIAINPTVLPDGLRSHQSYMNICLPMLREAEAVLLLPNWHQSVGAMMEYEEAKRLGMPMYHFTPVQDASICLFEGAAVHGQ